MTANLSEIAGWCAPDETREIVEQTRGVIEGTDEKVEELLALLRNQAAAAGATRKRPVVTGARHDRF